MLTCPKCNCEVSEGAKFCTTCGCSFVSDFGESAETTVLTADMNVANNQGYNAANNQGYNAAANQGYYQNQYAPNNFNQPQQPVATLKTNRSFIKVLLLSLITFGIYALVCFGGITDDVNLVCSRYDNKKTMNYYLLVFIVTPLTLGIASIVWMHKICGRIGDELKRRGVNYSFSSADFWLWNVLGAIILVGPFIFLHKFFKAVNLMNENYNMYG